MASPFLPLRGRPALIAATFAILALLAGPAVLEVLRMDGAPHVAGAVAALKPSASIVQAAYLTPTISVTIHDEAHDAVTSVPVGEQVHLRVRVSGSATTPTGRVTATFYQSSDCQVGPAGTAGQDLVDGVAHFGSQVRTTRVGTWSVKAVYGGSGLYNAIAVCRKFTVTKALPHVGVAIHDRLHLPITTIVVGNLLHLRATVTGDYIQPTGGVHFKVSAAADCSSPTTFDIRSFADAFTSTVESKSTSFDNKGVVYFRVTYAGDDLYQAANSPCVKLSISKTTPAVAFDVHDGDHDVVVTTLAINTVVHPFVRVTGSVDTPTGTFELHRFDNSTCSGTPSKQLVSLNASGQSDNVINSNAVPPTESSPRDTSWQVRYLGDSTYLPMTGACQALRWRAPVTIDADVHDAAHTPVDVVAAGTPVHLTVGLSSQFGIPTGTVEVLSYADGVCGTGMQSLGNVTLQDGQGVVDVGALSRSRATAGQLSFSAIYRATPGSSYLSRSTPCIAVMVTGPAASPGASLTLPSPNPSSGAGTVAPFESGPPTSLPSAGVLPTGLVGEASGGALPGASGAPGSASATAPGSTAQPVPTTGTDPGGVDWSLLVVVLIVVAIAAGSFVLGRRSRQPAR